jgi:pyridoxine kinase
MAILSIQSHVAFGHVGNAAVTLPLQRLGREVWAVHTVMFAAHAGYGPPRGPVFAPGTVTEVVAGLEARGVMPRCEAVLSGYLGDAPMGDAVLDAVARAKAANPAALYCCDPVMGDAGPGVYVRETIPDFMRTKAVPAADILTPNAFELGLLTGLPSETLEEAVTAARTLIVRGPSLVLVTSLIRQDGPPGAIEMLAVTAEAAWRVATPRFDLDPAPNGAGDLTAALFLAYVIERADPADALGRTAAAVHAVFDTTAAAGTRELALLAAQDRFRTPPQRFAVESVQ